MPIPLRMFLVLPIRSIHFDFTGLLLRLPLLLLPPCGFLPLVLLCILFDEGNLHHQVLKLH